MQFVIDRPQFAETLLEMWESEFPDHLERLRKNMTSEYFERFVEEAANEAVTHFIKSRAPDVPVMDKLEVAYRLVSISHLLSRSHNMRGPRIA